MRHFFGIIFKILLFLSLILGIIFYFNYSNADIKANLGEEIILSPGEVAIVDKFVEIKKVSLELPESTKVCSEDALAEIVNGFCVKYSGSVYLIPVAMGKSLYFGSLDTQRTFEDMGYFVKVISVKENTVTFIVNKCIK